MNVKVEPPEVYVSDAYNLSTRQRKQSIDLILTDPPYRVAKVGDETKKETEYPAQQTRLTTHRAPWDKDYEITQKLIGEFYEILRDGGTLILFYDFWKMESLREMLARAGFKRPRLIIWKKTNCIPVNTFSHYLANSKEFAVVAVKGRNPTFNSQYDCGIYEFSQQNRASIGIDHPTMKNLDMFSELIRKHTNHGDLVFDPFLGSGITCYAAMGESRRFKGGDISSEYIRQVKEKIEERSN